VTKGQASKSGKATEPVATLVENEFINDLFESEEKLSFMEDFGNQRIFEYELENKTAEKADTNKRASRSASKSKAKVGDGYGSDDDEIDFEGWSERQILGYRRYNFAMKLVEQDQKVFKAKLTELLEIRNRTVDYWYENKPFWATMGPHSRANYMRRATHGQEISWPFTSVEDMKAAGLAPYSGRKYCSLKHNTMQAREKKKAEDPDGYESDESEPDHDSLFTNTENDEFTLLDKAGYLDNCFYLQQMLNTGGIAYPNMPGLMIHGSWRPHKSGRGMTNGRFLVNEWMMGTFTAPSIDRWKNLYANRAWESVVDSAPLKKILSYQVYSECCCKLSERIFAEGGW